MSSRSVFYIILEADYNRNAAQAMSSGPFDQPAADQPPKPKTEVCRVYLYAPLISYVMNKGRRDAREDIFQHVGMSH